MAYISLRVGRQNKTVRYESKRIPATEPLRSFDEKSCLLFTIWVELISQDEFVDEWIPYFDQSCIVELVLNLEGIIFQLVEWNFERFQSAFEANQEFFVK